MQLVFVDKLRIPDDDTIIPRLRTETYLVSEYAAAMRLYDGWGDFPEVVCDQDYLVLSGVHRVLAARAAKVAKAKVKVVACSTAADRLLLAAEGNARHGKRWESKDIARISILADRFGIDSETISQAMRISVKRVERIPIATVVRQRNGSQVEERVYVKRSVRAAMRGRLIGEEQEALMNALTTPHTADDILSEVIRLHALDALPPLNEESARDARTVVRILEEWLARDAHLLGL